MKVVQYHREGGSVFPCRWIISVGIYNFRVGKIGHINDLLSRSFFISGDSSPVFFMPIFKERSDLFEAEYELCQLYLSKFPVVRVG